MNTSHIPGRCGFLVFERTGCGFENLFSNKNKIYNYYNHLPTENDLEPSLLGPKAVAKKGEGGKPSRWWQKSSKVKGRSRSLPVGIESG